MTGVASASEQLFVSRLARLSVRAPSGEMIGRIADVVIARAAPGSPPVVLGLTVWVQRRPIFIGMGRVRELDAGGATLSTGTVNLRPFELRAGETLVLGELVDSLVRHRETDREYRINDVAIAKVREDMASGLDDDRLAATLEQLPEEVQAGLLARLDDERAADVLEAMDPDDAAD